MRPTNSLFQSLSSVKYSFYPSQRIVLTPIISCRYVTTLESTGLALLEGTIKKHSTGQVALHELVIKSANIIPARRVQDRSLLEEMTEVKMPSMRRCIR